MSATRRPSIRALLERALASLPDRSSAGADARRDALAALTGRSFRAASLLRRYHDLLCFARAYPDDSAMHRDAAAELARLGQRVIDAGEVARQQLISTGLAGANMAISFPFDAASQLVRSFPGEVEFDWDVIDEPARLDALLVHVIAHAELQTFDDQEVDTREWIRLAKGSARGTDLDWLMRELRSLPGPEAIRGQIWNDLGLPILWSLAESRGSVTRLTLGRHGPARPWRRDAPKRITDAAAAICRPLGGVEPVDPTTAADLIEFTMATLAARAREVYAFNYANPGEIYLTDVGRGVQVIVVGALPARRLSLEGNYAYVACKNGVPVAYGGASPLFDQANTGLNVFEPYRFGGESAFLFTQILRTFRSILGTKRFVVSPYQIGEDNSEAIDSGAFWFYYKLGFRPMDPALAELAERENAKRTRKRGYRSDRATLKRLATGPIHLRLRGDRPERAFSESWLGRLALGATELLGRSPGSNRRAVVARITTEVAQRLRVRNRESWPSAEREAFRRMAVLVALIGGVDGWPAAERRALVRVMRLKGGATERDYARALSAHDRFRDGLAAWCIEHEKRD